MFSKIKIKVISFRANMSSCLETEKGDNWTVVVFHCPKTHWPQTLVSLFDKLDQSKIYSLPHFTIRREQSAFPDSLFVSLRIFSNQSHENGENNQIKEILNLIGIPPSDYRINPVLNPQGDIFESRQCWIAKGTLERDWPYHRCKVLSDLSRIAVDVTRNEQGDQRLRRRFAHLAYNMLGIDERPIRKTWPHYYY